MFFEQYSHEPYVAVARYKLWVLGEDAAQIAGLEQLHRHGYAALDAMERGLAGKDFFTGSAYSVADIALYAYTHVADTGGFDLGGYPGIRAWLARVSSTAGHVTIES